MPEQAKHSRAVLLMIVTTILWSTAGVMTRQLDVARGVDVTFWRSLFSALFIAGVLLWQQKSHALNKVRASGRLGLLSGLMWGVMFCCFMLALTMTTVANTLIVMSVSPLLTALLAWLFLRQHIAARTWLAIAVALIGIVWMFANGISSLGGKHAAGMMMALGVPLATSINVITMKKAGQGNGEGIDLVPAVLLGSLFSALAMLPLAWPLHISSHDLGILAGLGFFQLGLPCMMMVIAAKSLSAPEISLLALLEVLLGPIWAWLGAGEVPAHHTLVGGAVVLIALVFNELGAARPTMRST